MSNILNLVQIAISALLIAAILVQQRGTGLSAVFGGEGNVYRTRRGFEKTIFISTIILIIIFLGTSLFRVIFQI